MKTLFRLLAILALLATALPAGAETTLVLGRAPLGTNEAAAKDAAVADALSRAVARAAATSLDPVTLRNNLAALDQQVLADAKRYITNYTLVASAPSGESYLALVSVTIDQRALTHALIRAALKLPTSHMGAILVMVSEETAPGRPSVYWWSGLPGAPDAPAPLVKVIKSMGVRIINPQPLKALLTPDMRSPMLSEAQALEFARQAGAQVVLLGTIRTYPLVTPQHVMPPPLAQLLALDTKSGQVMAIEESEGPAYHTTPAPEEYRKILSLVETAGRNLMAKLAAKLAEISPAEKKLTLKVSGVRSQAQLMRLEGALRTMDNLVESMRRVSTGAGQASFDLTLKSSPSALADQLMAQNYGDFLVNVVEQDSRNLEVVIVPRQPKQSGPPPLKPGGPAPWEGKPGGDQPNQQPGQKQGDQKQPAKFPWEQGQGAQPAGQKPGEPPAQKAAPAQQPAAQKPAGQDKPVKFPWEQDQGAQGTQKAAPAQPTGGQTSGQGQPAKFPWEQAQPQVAPSKSPGAAGQ